MFLEQINHISHSTNLHIVIGAFDGVHQGHQHIIQQMLDNAKKLGGQSLIFSFEPLPKEFFLKEDFAGRLLPSQIKQDLLEQFHADYTIITDFEHIKDLSEKEFIELLLTKAEYIYFYSGNDFRMGCKNGHKYQGTCITKICASEIIINNQLCRASNIRKLLTLGEISLVNQLLGRDYSLYSYTISGDKIGRTIGFPTVNIKVLNQIIPKDGAYFGELIIYNHLYPAIIYIGKRPTVDGVDLRVESHVITEFPYHYIPDGTLAEVKFIQRIAEEKKFKSLENLKEMLYNYKTISLELASKRYQKK